MPHWFAIDSIEYSGWRFIMSMAWLSLNRLMYDGNEVLAYVFMAEVHWALLMLSIWHNASRVKFFILLYHTFGVQGEKKIKN